ncbi:MAG TPA: TolC family protein [Vampirovibrionales bacterium]
MKNILKAIVVSLLVASLSQQFVYAENQNELIQKQDLFTKPISIKQEKSFQEKKLQTKNIVTEQNLGVLSLEKLFDYIDTYHPSFNATKEEANLAQAKFQKAQSVFIPNIRNRFQLSAFEEAGFKKKELFDETLELSWQSPFGVEIIGGFRSVSDGPLSTDALTYPSDKKAYLDTVRKQSIKTTANTEALFGFKVPIARGLLTDEYRTDYKVQKIEKKIADNKILQKRSDVFFKAAQEYWKWVEAGLIMKANQEIYNLAENRQNWIKERVLAGLDPSINLVEANSQLFSRKTKVNLSEQKFKQASVELTNFLVFENKEKVMLSKKNLSDDIPLPKRIPSELQKSHKLAVLSFHPDLKTFRLKIEQEKKKLRLARNSLLPKLDFEVLAGQDVGRSNGNTSIRGAIFSELPLIPLEAKANINEATSKIKQNELNLEQERLKVLNEIQKAVLALENSEQRYQLSKENINNLQKLKDGELLRFKLGSSNLFLVNQRENSFLKGQVELIEALTDFQMALINYRYAIGEWANPNFEENWYSNI